MVPGWDQWLVLMAEGVAGLKIAPEKGVEYQ